jgi:hypothetical protein
VPRLRFVVLVVVAAVVVVVVHIVARSDSFVQYTLPSTGELIPLLHIAPSKTDAERLLVISPELADVLSTIVARVRDTDRAVPLVVDYDRHERIWNPPAPLLFQRRLRVENRPITEAAIRDMSKMPSATPESPTPAANP